ILYGDVLAVHKSFFLQTYAKRSHYVIKGRGRRTTKKADQRHRRLLRARRERPRHRTAGQRDELASLHSITSSASASSVGGISTHNAFAVAGLMTRSILF